jgi:hypothetical protein
VPGLTPLIGISPRDSKEHKRKECKERLGQNGIDDRCTRHNGSGVLSFLHIYLVHSSLSIVLLSLGWSRASIAGRRCSRSFSWGGRSTLIGTLEGKVNWLSTLETSLACFHGCCTSTSWGPLHILILSVQGLKEIGAQIHLSLWGDKSLSSLLRHPLNTLLHEAEGRSTRQRFDTKPRVAALLTLVFLLVLA